MWYPKIKSYIFYMARMCNDHRKKVIQLQIFQLRFSISSCSRSKNRLYFIQIVHRQKLVAVAFVSSQNYHQDVGLDILLLTYFRSDFSRKRSQFADIIIIENLMTFSFSVRGKKFFTEKNDNLGVSNAFAFVFPPKFCNFCEFWN